VRDLAVNAFQIMGPRAADHDGVVHWGLVCSGLRGLKLHSSVYRGLAVREGASCGALPLVAACMVRIHG
jgi:hypothetical protein